MSRPALFSVPSISGSPRPSARVATIAEMLDCAESDVRRLIDCGQLSAHGLGRRGVRVYLDSVADYQASHNRAAKKAVEKPAPRQNTSRAAHLAAAAELRKSGILR